MLTPLFSVDSTQYAPASIAHYEAVYGRNFVSPGGAETAREFLAMMELRRGMTVLDVGCGLGGAAFLMAEQYDVRAHGIDLSAAMIAMARKRCEAVGLTDRVTLTQGDILTFDGDARYDRVHSRDVFLHIHEKPRLMEALMGCLIPGGRLLFTDYCRGTDRKSAGFEAYIEQRQYSLCTVTEYRDLLAHTGFADIIAEDRTPQFIRILEHELAQLPTDRFTSDTLVALQQSWRDKIARARRGEQRWGLFRARRPMR